MNDLHAAAQQALEAYSLRDYDFGKYMEALRAALAEPVQGQAQEHPCATQECMPSQCPNCASLESQNTELDRKLADLEQTSLELCETCGWRTLIPGDCCLNCTRSDPDELTVVYMMGYEEGMKAVLKKMEDRLKEKEARDA